MAKRVGSKSVYLKGTKADDSLLGGAAADLLRGKHGDDTLVGGGGGDILIGGKGADRFTYLDVSDSRGRQIDLIADFDAREGDKVDLRALGTAVLQPSYNSGLAGLQAVFTYNAALKLTTLSYFSGSSTPVFQLLFKGAVTYSEEAFLGIVRQSAPTEGDDNLTGTAGNDVVDLLGGNDTYDGLGGNDSVGGGEGDDTLSGGIGNDTLRGDRGNDRLIGGAGDDLLQGFHGSDVLTGGTGADTFWLTWLYDAGDVDRMTDFNRGEGDKIDLWSSRVGRFANLGWVLVDGEFSQAADANHEAGQIVQAANGDGTYTLSFYYSNQTSPAFKVIVNTKLVPSDFLGNNWVQYLANPTEAADSFVGFNGDDRIDLLGGNDTYDGLSGNDDVRGGAGNDTLRTGNPIGTTIGGSRIDGGSGNDLLTAGSGQDTLSGGDGTDTLYGGDSNDALDGGNGSDELYGEDGDDSLFGGDWITSSSADGSDLLDGGAGNDQLNGWYGDDTLLGGAGDDLLNGSFGTDTLTGGAGADIFSYGSPIEGDDIILDFNRAEGDKIDFTGNDSNRFGRDGITGWWFAGDSYRPDLQSTGQGQIVVTANGDGTYTFSAYYAFSTMPGTPDIQTIVNTAIDASDFLGVTQAPAAGAVAVTGLVF